VDKLADLKPGDVLGQVDLASYIGAMGKGVAEAQKALDDNTIGLLGVFTEKNDSLAGKSLIQLGLSPAFYHFRSATLSASISMSIRVREETDLSVHVGGSKSSSSSAAAATSSKDIHSASATVVLSQNQTATASSQSGLTAIELIDSYSWSNSTSSEQFVLAEREALASTTGLVGTGLVGFSSAGVYVVPPPGQQWAVIRLVNASAANESYQIKPSGAGPYAPAPNLAPKAIAAGIKAHIPTAVVLLLSSDGQAASGPDDLGRVLFDTGSHTVKASGGVEYAGRVRALAHIVAAASPGTVKLTGHTDGVGPAAYNQRLSELRAEAVRDALVANGVSANAITTEGKGETEAANNVANPDQRSVTVSFSTSWTGCLLYLEDAPANLGNPITPPGSATANGVIGSGVYLASGTGTASGAAVSTAALLAAQFASSSTVTASAVGELVYLTNKENGSAVVAKVRGYATSQSSQASSSTSNLNSQTSTVDSSTVDTFKKNTVNRAAAIAGSVDARFARMFDMSMSGNMSIAAELVSIPAPPEFLQFIKDHLED